MAAAVVGVGALAVARCGELLRITPAERLNSAALVEQLEPLTREAEEAGAVRSVRRKPAGADKERATAPLVAQPPWGGGVGRRWRCSSAACGAHFGSGCRVVRRGSWCRNAGITCSALGVRSSRGDVVCLSVRRPKGASFSLHLVTLCCAGRHKPTARSAYM